MNAVRRGRTVIHNADANKAVHFYEDYRVVAETRRRIRIVDDEINRHLPKAKVMSKKRFADWWKSAFGEDYSEHLKNKEKR